MGSQSSDSSLAGSSIALLQERFKKLERVREKREEQELLKLVSGPEPAAAPPAVALFLPLSPPPQDGLSLGLKLNSPGKQPAADCRAIKSRASRNIWSSGSTAMNSISPRNENSEVDTSLHL